MNSRLVTNHLQLRRLSLALALVAAQLGLLAIVATSADATAARWYLRNSNSAGSANITFNYGDWGGTMTPVVGDWDNNGSSTPGMFDTAGGSPANWYLRNSNSAGAHDIFREYGLASGKPVVGNWNCTGDQTNVYKEGAWYLRHTDGSTTVEHTGSSAHVPVLGDSDHYEIPDGSCDNPAVFNPSLASWQWNIGLTDAGYFSFYYGSPGDIPLMGDWNGDGTDGPGVYHPATAQFFLSNDEEPPFSADYSFVYGNNGWKPVVGDWDDDGDDTIGLVAPAP